MIHTCNKRIDYVNQFLVTSLTKQGIKRRDIIIFNDFMGRGNLQSYLDSIDYIVNSDLRNEKGIWHLQDDVIISSDFKVVTELYNNDMLVNGFVSEMYNSDKLKLTGVHSMKNHWLSFQCIYIPNKYLNGFLAWMDGINNQKDTVDKRKYDRGRNDDYFFYKYLRKYYKNDMCMNLKPNLVDHIDYLIGNSTLYGKRSAKFRSYYFKDVDLIKKLEKELKND